MGNCATACHMPAALQHTQTQEPLSVFAPGTPTAASMALARAGTVVQTHTLPSRCHCLWNHPSGQCPSSVLRPPCRCTMAPPSATRAAFGAHQLLHALPVHQLLLRNAAGAAAYAAMTLTATGAAAGTSSDRRGSEATNTCSTDGKTKQVGNGLGPGKTLAARCGWQHVCKK